MKTRSLGILILLSALRLPAQVSTDIPLIVIETPGGVAIPDEPKITARMKIIDHGPGQLNRETDPGNVYDGLVGIEIRGSYSASLPQKPFGFETRDVNGENLNISLLGLPEENDWILLANYNDKSFLRNSLAGHIFRQMGHYAPRTRHVEVMVNGSYEGIYVLTEKIKRDKNRVDIATLNPDENSGDELTGGYIFKNDYYSEADSWISSFPPFTRSDRSVYFVYVYPKPDEITEAQKQYLQAFVFSYEQVLHSPDFADPQRGYRAYLDVGSFRDYFILSEVSRNVDAYKKSRFFFKDRESNGGLLHSGPPWDYDWAWKDIWDCPIFSNTDGSGWAYLVNQCEVWPTPPVYMTRLQEDPSFTSALLQRYNSLRQTCLSDVSLDAYIDSVTALLVNAQERHYERWDILGENVGAPEVGSIPTTFGGEMRKFKDWIHSRLAWLDRNMPGDGPAGDPGEIPILRVFPNPAADLVYIESGQLIERIEICSLAGQIVLREEDVPGRSATLEISYLRSGIYLVHVFLHGGDRVSGKLLVE
ncbi:MAG: CotH kinase family protein [Bacteroidales bacterium]